MSLYPCPIVYLFVDLRWTYGHYGGPTVITVDLRWTYGHYGGPTVITVIGPRQLARSFSSNVVISVFGRH